MSERVKIKAVVIEGKPSITELSQLLAALAPWGVAARDIVDSEVTRSTSAGRYDEIDFMRDLQDGVASELEIDPEHIISKSRSARWSRARAAFAWLAHEIGARPAAEVGRFMKTDHSTALYHVARARELLSEDSCFSDMLDRLTPWVRELKL